MQHRNPKTYQSRRQNQANHHKPEKNDWRKKLHENQKQAGHLNPPVPLESSAVTLLLTHSFLLTLRNQNQRHIQPQHVAETSFKV
jgi:predicted alpha/beta hydrolase family esterase